MAKWISIWGNAPSTPEVRPQNYTSDITFRYLINSTISGNSVKIRISNLFGKSPLYIGKATIMPSDNQFIGNDKATTLLFSGKKDVVIQPGLEINSDAVNFNIEKGQNFLISIYVSQPSPANTAVYTVGEFSKGKYAFGDQTENFDFDVDRSGDLTYKYYLTSVDILTNDLNAKSIIAYGDSITCLNWPDELQKIIADNGENQTVIRKAISGSRILREYSNMKYLSYGQSGFNRFEREMDSVHGAESVIIMHGINDIIHPDGKTKYRPLEDMPTVNDLIDGTRFYIEKARLRNLKVYVCTLLPIKGWRTYEDFREPIRTGFNDWIRQTDEIDGAIDLDLALRDLSDINAFDSIYDKGDHLHPSELGCKKMAQKVYDVLKKD